MNQESGRRQPENPLPSGRGVVKRWFDYSHLPEDLQVISRQVKALASDMDERLPETAEKTAGLRKLLEAKDAFVRAAIEGRDQ